MTKEEFGKWLSVHCGLFDGVRRFAKAETLDEWERLLIATPLHAAIAASRRIYEGENRPRDYSDHAAAVKRAAAEIVRAEKAQQQFGPSKGEREYQLRQRFAEEWKSLGKDQRETFLRKAREQCPKRLNDEFSNGLLEVYAWTLFAESCDPKEARAIENAGWSTLTDVDAGAVPVGGW